MSLPQTKVNQLIEEVEELDDLSSANREMRSFRRISQYNRASLLRGRKKGVDSHGRGRTHKNHSVALIFSIPTQPPSFLGS